MATFRFADDEGTLAGQEGVVMACAVRHPSGVVLFDTGFGFGSKLVDERYHPQSRRIHEVLADAGVDPQAIIAIINCHLHIDHAGQNSAFPRTPIHAQPAEWEAAHGEDYTILEWVDFPNAGYRLHAGDYELLPGIRVLATPGHTPGHQSLAVDTTEGLSILAGQAVYSRDEWIGAPTDREGASRAWDRAAYDRSIERLRDLAPAAVHFGHDRSVWTA
jgi:glyoxylase-like metal-dependent hydrolase (beta-lactamase superfamily II)